MSESKDKKSENEKKRRKKKKQHTRYDAYVCNMYKNKNVEYNE